jgi:hypothetical protein
LGIPLPFTRKFINFDSKSIPTERSCHCGVVTSYRKVYVDDEDDEELIPTENNQTYLRKSGNSIKKVGPIKTRGF